MMTSWKLKLAARNRKVLLHNNSINIININSNNNINNNNNRIIKVVEEVEEKEHVSCHNKSLKRL